MPTPTDRDTAAELAQRIKTSLVDPDDEANLPPSDRPPGYADALMSEAPASPGADLSPADWALIGKALEHYASGG